MIVRLLLLLLNAYRADVTPLSETGLLDLVAQQRCAQQVAQGAISHDGLPSGLGENLAAGYESPEAVMAGWASSPGHASNMRNPAYREVGLAVCHGAPWGTYWVQVFGLGDRRMFRQGWLGVARD